MYDLNVEDLCSGLFSDVMDSLGYRHQVITGFIKNKDLVSALGRARTVKIETMDTKDENIRKGLSFLAEVGKDEVLIVKGSNEFAYFGELMTKLSTRQQIEGVIIDGLTRDTNYTHSKFVTLPIMAKGYSPVDIKGRGRVEDTDVVIEIDGIKVKPNDLIYMDNEAICVVPKEIEEEVIRLVKEKIAEEQRITELIKSGISVEKLLETVVEF